MSENSKKNDICNKCKESNANDRYAAYHAGHPELMPVLNCTNCLKIRDIMIHVSENTALLLEYNYDYKYNNLVYNVYSDDRIKVNIRIKVVPDKNRSYYGLEIFDYNNTLLAQHFTEKDTFTGEWPTCYGTYHISVKG